MYEIFIFLMWYIQYVEVYALINCDAPAIRINAEELTNKNKTKQKTTTNKQQILTCWRLVPSILGLGSMGSACYKQNQIIFQQVKVHT